MTHKQLVTRVANWLKWTKKCTIVAAELRTQNSECPDVLAFYGAGGSILVECKVSRADFLADTVKVFRQFEDMGMGDTRYYACPPGIIKVGETPEGWGLLEVSEGRIFCPTQPVQKETNKRNEVKVLMSILRRLEISTAVFVRQEEPQTEPDNLELITQ